MPKIVTKTTTKNGIKNVPILKEHHQAMREEAFKQGRFLYHVMGDAITEYLKRKR